MSFQQALSGLNASSSALDAIGNNIANASTVGFKQANAQFADAYAAALGGGAGVGQIGMGTSLATVAQQFSQGSITADNNPLDIAINGGGFFQMTGTNGSAYTRAGQFQLDQNGYIVDASGAKLNLFPPGGSSTAGPIAINNGNMGAVVTTNLGMNLNLDARQSVPTTATFSPNDPTSYNESTSATVYDSLGVSHTLGMYFVKTGTNSWDLYTNVDGGTTTAAAAAAATPPGVANLFGPAGLAFNSSGVLTTSPSGTNTGLSAMFGTPAAATTQGASIGSVAPTLPLTVAAGTNDQFNIALDGAATPTAITIPPASYATAASLAAAMNAAFTTASVAATASVDPATGKLVVTSNSTTATSAVALSAVTGNTGLSAMFGAAPTTGAQVSVSGGTAPANPLVVTAGTNDQFTLTVNGGTPLSVTIPAGSYTPAQLATQLQTSLNALSPSPDVTVSANGSGVLTVSSSVLPATPAPTLALGSVNNLGSSSTIALALPLSSSSGSNGPLNVTLNLAGSTQFGNSFGVNSVTQDGSAAGQFTGLKVLPDGTVQGTYNNGMTKSFGTIALATFKNPNGLIPTGDNQWLENLSTVNGSGPATLGTPGSGANGILQPSAIEGSNVDLTAQLVDMITQQRNYQANAQTIKTEDSIMQTLINLR